MRVSASVIGGQKRKMSRRGLRGSGEALLLGAANGLTDVAMNTRASTLERRWGAAILSSFHAAFSCGGRSPGWLASAS